MSDRSTLELGESEFAAEIRAISDLLTSKPLAAIDRAISVLRNNKDPKREGKLFNLFARGCLSFSDSERMLSSEHPVDELFSPESSSTARKQI